MSQGEGGLQHTEFIGDPSVVCMCYELCGVRVLGVAGHRVVLSAEGNALDEGRKFEHPAVEAHGESHEELAVTAVLSSSI